MKETRERHRHIGAEEIQVPGKMVVWPDAEKKERFRQIPKVKVYSRCQHQERGGKFDVAWAK